MNAEDMEYDYEHEITDEELQQLIDKNEADSEEPGGISDKRREKLVREVSERLKDDPLCQSNLDAATKTDKNETGLNETVIEKCLESADPYFSYLVMRRNALRDGYSADEIDDMTTEWAEQYGIDLDVLDKEWVGAEPLRQKQIRRIENEEEQDAAIEALATENVLRRERQEAKRAVNELTDEWFKEQCKTSWKSELKYFFKHPLSSDALVFILIILGIFTVGAIGALWVLLFDGLLGEDWAFFCYMALVVTIFVTVGRYSEKRRRRKHPEPPKRIFSDSSDVDFFR